MRKIRFVIVQILVLVMIFSFAGCSSERTMEIETSFGTIFYPKKYEDNIKIVELQDGNLCFVEFWGVIEGKKDTRLFDIIYGDSAFYEIGRINGVKLAVESFDINTEGFTAEEVQLLNSLQGEIDTVLENLVNIPGFVDVDMYESTENVNDNKIAINSFVSTPYGDILYPTEWDADMSINSYESDGIFTVEFKAILNSGDEMPLFDVSFGEQSEESIGVIKLADKEVWINIIYKEIDREKVTDSEELQKVFERQERIDYVIEQLIGFENTEMLF